MSPHLPLTLPPGGRAKASKPTALLEARGLTKRFGGLAANKGVNVSVLPQQIHAVIGPNGAGKSTLSNLLSGDLVPDEGTIQVGGVDITGQTAFQFSRRGVGRSFQKTNIFLPLSVEDNVRLAAQSRGFHSPWNPRHWIDRAQRARPVTDRTQRALHLAGLTERRHMTAGACSHGEQRQLEIAMTLATEPQVLLLDEPLAGMGSAESERMVALLRNLRELHGVLLVEHDMDAVFSLADVITVMVNGEVIAHGTPHSIKTDGAVRAAYLGELA